MVAFDSFRLGSMVSESSHASNPNSKCKRMRVSDELGSQIMQQSFKRARSVVMDAMDNDPQVAFQIQYLIENKKLTSSERQDETDKLPQSCNKWALLKKERVIGILVHLQPDVCTQALLVDMAAVELRKLLGFALSVDVGSALPSKCFSSVLEWASNEYENANKRLSSMQFVTDGGGKKVPNYSKHGVFSLIKADDDSGSILGIRHMNNQRVVWATPRAPTLTLVDNHSEITARLLDISTKMSCDVLGIFIDNKLGDAIPQPTHEDKVSTKGQLLVKKAKGQLKQSKSSSISALPKGGSGCSGAAPAPPV